MNSAEMFALFIYGSTSAMKVPVTLDVKNLENNQSDVFEFRCRTHLAVI